MSFTERTQAHVDASQIRHGCDVYGADGEEVGYVSEVSSGYLVVSKGYFFSKKERYVPTSAIDRIEHDRLYLNLTKADLGAERWDTAPEATETHTRPGAASPPGRRASGHAVRRTPIARKART